MKNIIIRDNINKNEVNYLVKYKSGIDNYKKYKYVVMNKDEKDYILNNYTTKNGKIEIQEYHF